MLQQNLGCTISLKSVLNSEDAILGPWSEGFATFEDQVLNLPPKLSQYPPAVWLSKTAEDALNYPQAINVQLVDLATQLFGTLFSSLNDSSQDNIVTHLLGHLKVDLRPTSFLFETKFEKNLLILIYFQWGSISPQHQLKDQTFNKMFLLLV